MAKPVTEESKINVKYDDKGKINKGAFTLELDADIFNKLIDYLILTNRPTDRLKFVNELITNKLKDKVLDNSIIDLYQNPYYFNVTELLKNKTVIATKKPILKGNQDEIFVVRRVPNNLDNFNKDLETYCVGNNKHIHAGYYILPKYKDHDEKHFTFKYDSEKEEIEINLVNPNDIDIIFNPLDDEKQKIKGKIIKNNVIATHLLKNNDINPNDIINDFNIMYNYSLNLRLRQIKEKSKREELTDEEKAEHDKIYYDAVFF